MSGYFGTHFYHRITRKMVVVFGNLFNDIQMVRYNKAGTTELERITVPIMYGQKEKFLLRITQDPELTRSIQVYLPRLSFVLDGINYDPTRKQQTLIANIKTNTASQSYKQYLGVPYDFNFTLSLYTRNIEDGLQIIEQILPIFRPDFTLSVELDSTMGITKDIPIILNSVDYNINYEGEGADLRLVMWDLNFTVKGYLLGPSTSAAIIKSANTNFYDASTKGMVPGGVFTSLTGINRGNVVVLNMQPGGYDVYKENELIYQQGNTYVTAKATGDVLEWDNVTRKLYINNVSGTFIVNSDVNGIETGARWNVASYYVSNVPTVTVNVKPNPNTAGPTDDYGFTTTILEFPDTI